jgi:AraC-like DNA-binding protein
VHYKHLHWHEVDTLKKHLQRMMKEHGLGYSELLNEARQHYALEKLKSPSIKISDIAFQLGYRDAAHFTRAFKRWTGMTPSQYSKSAMK